MLAHLAKRHRPKVNRLFRGGGTKDSRRVPRYVVLAVLSISLIWAAVAGFVRYVPPVYSSMVSLILPGSGANASVNLADLGQASSSSASPFSSSRISPTQTYKRLLAADQTLARAARSLGVSAVALGKPHIRLVDETALIHFEMRGPTAQIAQAKSRTVLDAFRKELDILRRDELTHRDNAVRNTIAGFKEVVEDLREQIAVVQRQSGLISYEHYQDLVGVSDDLEGQLKDARAAKLARDASTKALAKRLHTNPALAAANLRLYADAEFQDLAAELASQSSKLALDRGRFGEAHPKVTLGGQIVDGTKAHLRARAQAILGRDSVSLDRLDIAPDPSRAALLADLVERATDCKAHEATVAALTSELKTTRTKIAELAPLASRLDDLSRDHKVAEAVFASALARLDTGKSDVYASYPLVQVLAAPSLPERRNGAAHKASVAGGAAGTFFVFIALGLAWYRQPMIDHVLRNSR